MDLNFLSSAEIVSMVCTRLKQERLLHEWTQSELARRAGITVSTLSNLEMGKNTSFETLVKVAMVLGRSDELADLFKPKINSINDIKRLEIAKDRRRIRERKYD